MSVIIITRKGCKESYKKKGVILQMRKSRKSAKIKVNHLINALFMCGVVMSGAFMGLLISPQQSSAAPMPEIQYVEVPVEVVVTAEPENENVPANLTTEVEVAGWDDSVNYMDLMDEAIQEAIVAENSKYAMAMGDIYETARNKKIDELGLGDTYAKTNFFTRDADPLDIYYEMYPDRKPWYTEEDLDLACKVVGHESGSNFIPDEHQQLVASVILNRKNNGYWGDTIYDVVTAPGQYAGISQVSSWTYDERVYNNVKYVFDNGPICPENVLYQSNIASNGKGYYKTFYYPQLGTTTYFAYG